MLITVCLAFGTIDEYYTFTASSGTYTPITGTNASISTDDALSAAIPLGFAFPYGDNSYTEIKLDSNGYVALGSTLSSYSYGNDLTSTTVIPIIAPLWDDLSMASGTVEYLLNGEAPNQVFIVQYSNVKWNYNGATQFNFQVRLYQDGKIEIIYGPGTGTPNNPTASIGINMLPGGLGNYFSITPGSPATASTTVANNAITTIPAEGTLYEFNPVVPVSADLSGVSVTGNATPTAGEASDYIVTIRNRGSEVQSAYQVYLYRGAGIEIGSVAGTEIQPGTNLSFTIPWTPAAEGPETLYGQVILAGDQNTANDQTPNLNVVVMAAGALVVSIGDGTTTNSTSGSPTPYGTFYKNFRQQYLYTAAEMFAAGAAPGLITSLGFNVQAVNTCSPMPNFTIRVKSTAQASLSTTFEVGDYTTVWFQNNFVPVAGWNTHAFSTPFMWDGVSNILVEIVTTLIPGNYTQNASVFYTATTGVNTALRYESDTVDAGTSTTGSVSVNRANVRLSMSISGMAALNGTVSSGGNPVEGAEVVINAAGMQTLTDALGHYEFPYVQPGDYTVTAGKFGYVDQSLPVTLVANQTSTLDFTLTPLPQVTVSGRIVGSDASGTGIGNAAITLAGYQNYSASSDADGYFTIANVYANQTYAYAATAPGYQNATGTALVGAGDLDLGDIILNDIAYPPSNVVATEAVDFSNVILTWVAPDPNATPVETFETGDFSAFPWIQGGTAPWFVSADTFHGGSYAAQSGDISDSQNSTIETSRNVLVAGDISFWYSVSSESGWDYLKFYVDGVQLGSWSGTVDWTQAFYPLTVGVHMLKWEYSKDGSASSGSDCARIDDISFPASVPGRNSGKATRSLVGYKVWRLLAADQGNESTWISLTTDPITDITFTDNAWQPLPAGIYKYAVKAAYTNAVLSTPAFSNELTKTAVPVQSITLNAGWNLISLNVSPPDHSIATLISLISASVLQIKGTDGVYIPGNPYNTLTSFSDGRAYNILMSESAVWNVSGTAIPVSNPLPLSDGWNMVAYIPQTDMAIATALQSIETWLIQVKGTDGVYIPGNPYSTLSTMYPGKGYWMKLSGAHDLIYPSRSLAVKVKHSPRPEQVQIKTLSMTVLARCDWASAGDILLARVGTELRGSETLISPEGFPAALIQIYTEQEGEQISFAILTAEGTELPVSTTLISQPQESIGSYPEFFILAAQTTGTDDPSAVPTRLLGCYPNPFNPSTTISYSLKEAARVRIEIFNARGQRVTTLLDAVQESGNHSLIWNGLDQHGSPVSSGVYLYRMSAGTYRNTRRMIMAK